MSELDFSGLPADELTTLRTNALAGLNAILNVGQSYSMMGRSFTKANVGELTQIISAITRAIDAAAGTTQRWGFANVNESMFGGA